MHSLGNVHSGGHPFFAVLGPHRSGTSCVAMVMHHLGVHMGNRLGGYEPTGGGEAVGLARLCEGVMRFPACNPTVSDRELTRRLQSWLLFRTAEAVRKETVAGGKYPHLCRFAKHLYAAIEDSLRIVAVDRPIEASIRSLQNRSQKHMGKWFAASDSDCEQLQRSLLEHREAFIETHPDVPVHRVAFAELTNNPEEEIRRLAHFLTITPSSARIHAAVAHVNPEMRVFDRQPETRAIGGS